MSTNDFRFETFATAGAARRGRITMVRGTIETPAFMPVGTAATVKAMTPESVRESGAEILLANTYHLMLRPGDERIARLGGLHQFMNWQRPILTDSGGFQVMSLAKLREIDKDGVTFQSHIDGSRHRLTPERAMEVQLRLGSDIAMVFDECTPFPTTRDVAAHSMELSMEWAERSKAAFGEPPGRAVFGIVQGGVYPDLRAESAGRLKAIGFPGYAIGGLAVGEGQDAMFAVLDATVPHLPANRPRYLMGVGRPADIVGAVKRGVDMFDCVLPTRSGRTGQGFTAGGTINLRNSRHADDARPISETCSCPACRSYSRAYLHHLVKSGEILGAMLLTWHNLTFFQDLMRGIREAIEKDRLGELEARLRSDEEEGDIPELEAS